MVGPADELADQRGFAYTWGANNGNIYLFVQHPGLHGTANGLVQAHSKGTPRAPMIWSRADP